MEIWVMLTVYWMFWRTSGLFSWPSFFLNIFINDVNYSVGSFSLLVYACYTTQYGAQYVSPVLFESTLNQDVIKLSQWITETNLQVNTARTQLMTLGKSEYVCKLLVGDQTSEIEPISLHCA